MPNLYVSNHPLVAHKLTKLRSVDTEPKKFRELVGELAGLLAYEATSDLVIEPVRVQTPLKEPDGYQLVHKIGLIPILRAGVGMVEGGWNFMPSAEVWQIGIYRYENTPKAVPYQNTAPIDTNV